MLNNPFQKQRRFLVFIITLIIGSTALSQKANVPGDFPDPSIIKFGDAYYCSATSSNWTPGFPILKSNDLKNWEWISNIFETKPDWIINAYWAPELSVDNGKIYVYYTARKKGGGLCLGVASADKPEGPYKDHGPIICEAAGSIDGYAIRDEHCKLWFIWKTDANSIKQPTPIWIQEMNEERTSLIGEKKMLIVNDMKWEDNLIEGPSLIKINDYYYMFYSAAGCCGRNCSYKTGVARAKNLLGPWEKDPANPILVDEENWKCQGHGSPIKVGDQYYFIYHGYSAETGVFAGRQGLLREIVVTPDNWVRFTAHFIESEVAVKNGNGETILFSDDFNHSELKPSWNWPVMQQPEYEIANNSLVLHPVSENLPALFGQKIYTKNYSAIVELNTTESTVWSGIALIGDESKYVCAMVKNDSLKLFSVKGKETTPLSEKLLERKAKTIVLKVEVANNSEIRFLYSTDNMKFELLNEKTSDAKFLPPWDRALRVGLISKGCKNGKSVFDNFILKSE